MKFTGGKDIETESIIVKYKTLEKEGDNDNNDHNVDSSLGDHNNQRRSVRKKKLNGYSFEEIQKADIIGIVN